MKTRTPSINKEASLRSLNRSVSPIDATFITSTRPFTPYPLYKQKVRTLLKPPDYSRQPPNFMSARETRSDFEKKEASLQVKILKSTLNQMREGFDKGTKKMTVLLSESHKVSELEHVGQHDVSYLLSHYKRLQNSEEEMLTTIREELNNNLTYKHIRERLRQTLMHLELKNQYFQSQIRTKDFLIESEHRKKISTLEKKFNMVQAFRQTSKIVSLDMKDRTQDLNILEDDIEAREKIHELREKRMKKFEDIAEAAAIEEGDLKSNNVRERLLVLRMWTKYLNAHEGKIKKTSAKMLEAFKKIKIVTKITEPEEIIENFLRKEEKLGDLVICLNDVREKCEEIKSKNEEIESKISMFRLTQTGGIDGNIRLLRTEANESALKVKTAKDLKDRLTVVKQRMLRWVQRNLSLLAVSPKKNLKLLELFLLIKDTVLKKSKRFNVII